MKILLIASTGGHLAQLLPLHDFWRRHERRWVTFQKADALSALADEHVIWAHHPTTRNLPNAVRNLGLAVRTLRDFRPDVIVTTGAGVSLPFFVVARFLGIRTVYIEVFDRIDSPTLTGRLSFPMADAMCEQWEHAHPVYPGSVAIGPAL